MNLKTTTKYFYSNFVHILMFALITVTFFVFKDAWFTIIDKVLVTPLLSKFNSSSSLWLLLIGLIIICYYIVGIYHEKKINYNRVIIYIYISFIYTIFFNTDYWVFDYFELFSIKIYYSHIIFLPIIGELILVIKHLYIKNHLNNETDIKYNGLEFELAIKDTNDKDIYGRNSFISSIANKLSQTFSLESSFAVGVSGSWGTGKTSFSNILTEHFSKKVDVIISFKPWFSTKSEDIVKDFFSMYINEVTLYYTELNKIIPQYINALTDSDDGKLNNVFSYFFKSFFNKDAQTKYEEIKNVLSQNELKVVVMIDDLDRLNKEEILEVLKLIRNTANFPNTLFVVTYDKEYVIKSMVDTPNPEKYLHKIFNLEITLPKFELKIICTELYNKLKDVFSDYGNKEYIEDISWKISFLQLENDNYIIPQIIPTLRDVIRFSNALRLNIVNFNNNVAEINIADFILLELIRYSYSDLYDILKNNPLDVLKLQDVERTYSYESRKPEQSDLNVSKYTINSSCSPIIADKLLLLIFQPDKNTNSIIYTSSYFKYFAYRLAYDTLPIAILLNFVESDTPLTDIDIKFNSLATGEVFDKITYLFNIIKYNSISVDKIYIFIKKLLDSEFDLVKEVLLAIKKNLDRFEVNTYEHFRLFVDLWSFSSIYGEKYNVKYNHQKFLMTLFYRDNLFLVIRAFVNDLKIEELKDIIKNSKSSYIISPYISSYIESHQNSEINNSNLLFSIKELRDIQFDFLKLHLSSASVIDKNAIILFENCIVNIDTKTYKVTIRKEALALMREFIKKNPEGYFDNFVRMGISSADDWNQISPDPFLEQIFGSNDKLEEFINNSILDSIPKIKRVRNLWKLFKNNNYKSIEFSRVGKINDIIENDFEEKIELLEKLLDLKLRVENFQKIAIDKNSKLTHSKIQNQANKFYQELKDIKLYISLTGEIRNLIDTISGMPF